MKHSTVEPVLENYMSPPMSCGTASKANHGPVATSSAEEKHAKSLSSLNPLNFFQKLRDRNIRAMNEKAMRGNNIGMADYQGTVTGTHHSDTMDRQHLSAKEREMNAYLEQLVALQRNSDVAQ